MMEAVWLMRWSKNRESLHSVLKIREAEKICVDLIFELNKAGYKIVKKCYNVKKWYNAIMEEML